MLMLFLLSNDKETQGSFLPGEVTACLQVLLTCSLLIQK